MQTSWDAGAAVRLNACDAGWHCPDSTKPHNWWNCCSCGAASGVFLRNATDRAHARGAMSLYVHLRLDYTFSAVQAPDIRIRRVEGVANDDGYHWRK